MLSIIGGTMNYGIQYLCHLVQTKNDLNRRRRRFCALMSTGTERFALHEGDPRVKAGKTYKAYNADHHWFFMPKPMHVAYSKKECERGYRQAQLDMKAMTPEMRRARKEINARFRWSDHGAISWIEVGNEKLYPEQIKRFAELYQADKILLGE